MYLTSFYDPATSALTFGGVTAEGLIPIQRAVDRHHWLYDRNLGQVVAHPSGIQEALEALSGVSPSLDPDQVRYAPVIPHPPKVVCIGQNYWDHCREQKVNPPDRPILFAKLPNAYNAHREVIPVPPGCTQLDYEAELGVVIGRTAHRVTPESALDYVAGYTPVNDVSARDFQFGDRQWLRGKSQNGFAPMGPVLVPAEAVLDPQKLAIRCWVNDQLVQDSHTGEMIFDVRTLIAFISQGITLEPGDVVFTGTPHGVGIFRNPPLLLQPGDLVSVQIADWPRLENRIGPS